MRLIFQDIFSLGRLLVIVLNLLRKAYVGDDCVLPKKTIRFSMTRNLQSEKMRYEVKDISTTKMTLNDQKSLKMPKNAKSEIIFLSIHRILR